MELFSQSQKGVRQYLSGILCLQIVIFISIGILFISIKNNIDQLFNSNQKLEKALLIENHVQRQYVKLLWLLISDDPSRIHELKHQLDATTTGKIQVILDELLAYPHQDSQNELIHEYALLRQQFLNCRKQEIIPLKDSGEGHLALDRSQKVLHPLYEQRSKVIDQFARNERQESERIREVIFYKISSMLILLGMSILVVLLGVVRMLSMKTN